ncbi:MAG: hypothetical protein U0930_21500 [Pirellulales bacterium]
MFLVERPKDISMYADAVNRHSVTGTKNGRALEKMNQPKALGRVASKLVEVNALGTFAAKRP